MAGYRFEDLRAAYRKLGVKKGAVVYVSGDLACLGRPGYEDRSQVLEAHYRALRSSVGASGTLVVPTASVDLCNTSVTFDQMKTESRMGVLTEYVRRLRGTVRSFHPFISETAIGAHAHDICADIGRLPYGMGSPHARMLERDALCISIGLHPRITCSTVHHAEVTMGVPYRYVKEFVHPVMRRGRIRRESFYMHVWYKDCDLPRDGNRKIFAHFESAFKVRTARVGDGVIFGYSMRDFFNSAIESFKKDIYVWLDGEPANKPYRK